MSITDKAFKNFQDLVYKKTGIHLSDAKRQLIVSRFNKRLKAHDVTSFEEYYNIVTSSEDEMRQMIDIITTNETSFFREPHHFEYLSSVILPEFNSSKFRVWSAAASIGAEAYTTAMVLDHYLTPRNVIWEIVGTDINTEVIKTAQEALYPIRFAESIPQKYLKAYCLQGYNTNEGLFLIDDYLKRTVRFQNANLMNPPPSNIGQFDVIFLRNMLIYFDNKNKKTIVENVVKSLKSGSYLLIGHSETLTHITDVVRQIKPTIYRKD